MKILVSLSGGLDSTTVLALLLSEGHDCSAIGFDYQQPHRLELGFAERLARYYNAPFEVVALPVLPKVNDVVFAGRNLILAATLISLAQSREYEVVAFGCNASDWARFPDCRPAFWRGLSDCAEAYGVRVETPLIHANKREVVELARRLHVPIDLTWSCYFPKDGKPCRECLACSVREEALEAA